MSRALCWCWSLLLLGGCASGTLSLGSDFVPPDDDDASADDDDATADDDDATPDDDDASADDDDAVDDDDATLDDDDATLDDDDAVDDDDAAPDDDDVVPDDDDSVPDECATVVIDCASASEHPGNNGGPGSTDNTDWNACYGGGLTGPEFRYDFTAPYDGEFHFELSGLSEDIDLYALSGTDCDAGNCVEGSFRGDTDSEDFTLEADAGEVYVIAVDGFDGSVSDYVLELSCSGGDDDDATSPPDDDDATPTDDDDVVFPDDDDATGCTTGTYDGHTYLFCDDAPASQQFANVQCGIEGYELVTVDSEAENDFLADVAVSGTWWIGYWQPQPWDEGDFEWRGSPSNTGYENWAPNEPNDFGSWPGEDCVVMGAGTGWAWNDIGCGSSHGWICESS